MCIRKIVSEQKGAVAIMVAISSIILLGMAAFVIDFGYGWATTNELQNAADAGALAGVRALGKFYCPETDPAEPCLSKADQDDTTIAEVETAIKTTVKDVINQNKAANASIVIADGDIEIGTWDSEMKVFTPNATPPGAVRVRTRRDSTTNGSIKTFLGGIFGVSSLSLSKPATAALTGLSEVKPGEIDVPLGVSERRDCSNPTISLGDTKSSCAGWTSFFDPSGTQPPDLKNLLDGLRTDTTEAPAAKIGDTFYYTGGTQSGVFNALYNLYMAKRDPVTREWTVLMPVYDDPSETCENPNTGYKIVGFATMKLSDPDPAISSDDPVGCSASSPDEPIKDCPRGENVVVGKLICMVEPGRGGGATNWSVGSIPGLVQ
jgi:Flp pilus assembly protein TadG